MGMDDQVSLRLRLGRFAGPAGVSADSAWPASSFDLALTRLAGAFVLGAPLALLRSFKVLGLLVVLGLDLSFLSFLSYFGFLFLFGLL